MAALDKYEAPKPGEDTDQGKFKKLAQRVEETLINDVLYPEPKQLDPDRVWVSPRNRLGGSPNVQHVHHGILKSFMTDSYDRTRPLKGICVEIRSEKGLQELLQHNQKFTQGNKLMPPLLENPGGPVYAALACNHLNIALRAIKNQVSSPVGNLSDLMTNLTLKDVVLNGHKWWVLKESVAIDRQVDISVWRNSDQNQNNGTHELEVLQTIKYAAEGFLKSGKGKVPLGDLVASAAKRNPAKIPPHSWLSLAKYYIGFLENGTVDLVEDLHEFHSENVDPKTLCVPISFFQTLASEEALKKCPQVRHYLAATQYTVEKTRASGNGPDISVFLEAAQLTSFCKKPDQVNELEKTIRDLKSKYLPILEKHLGDRVGRLEMTTYIILIIRCLFAKPWPVLEPKMTLPVGKFDQAKIKSLGTHWAKVVDLRHPSLGFAELAGLQEQVKEDPEILQDVDLENLRTLKKNPSGGPDPDAPKYKRGDEVTVIRKMTWALPQKNNPNFRKDLKEGLQGIIEGWADSEMRTVLLKVDLTISGKTQSYTQGVYPRNLKLTSDYLLSKAGAASSGSADPAVPEEEEDGPQKFKWCVGSSNPGDVRIEPKWSKSLLADADDLTKNMYLRGRIAVGLEALYDALPKYKDTDFLVVYRRNEKGLWIGEVHTRREFEPLEIVLAPFSSQIKDTHLMVTAHALVTLPKHGRGAHPSNGTLAMDGRLRNVIASAGLLDKQEHAGSLYWMVTRTCNVKECNLDMDQITWQQNIKVNVPAPKKRKVEVLDWETSELPAFPVMVNKKKIEKHVKLCVFLADQKKKDPKKK